MHISMKWKTFSILRNKITIVTIAREGRGFHVSLKRAADAEPDGTALQDPVDVS